MELLFWYITFTSVLVFLLQDLIYQKYGNCKNSKAKTGFEIAQKIVAKKHLKDVIILEVKGKFNGTYDVKRNTIKLPSGIFHQKSVMALYEAIYRSQLFIEATNNHLIAGLNQGLKDYAKPVILIAYALLVGGLLLPEANLVSLGIYFLIALYLIYLFDFLAKLNVILLVRNDRKRMLGSATKYRFLLILLLLENFSLNITVLLDIYQIIKKRLRW